MPPTGRRCGYIRAERRETGACARDVLVHSRPMADPERSLPAQAGQWRGRVNPEKLLRFDESGQWWAAPLWDINSDRRAIVCSAEEEFSDFQSVSKYLIRKSLNPHDDICC